MSPIISLQSKRVESNKMGKPRPRRTKRMLASHHVRRGAVAAMRETRDAAPTVMSAAIWRQRFTTFTIVTTRRIFTRHDSAASESRPRLLQRGTRDKHKAARRKSSYIEVSTTTTTSIKLLQCLRGHIRGNQPKTESNRLLSTEFSTETGRSEEELLARHKKSFSSHA